MTDADNPWFARLAVNRLWKHFFGRGLVEPEDDLRSTNPATNEPLLDFLARRLSQARFDLKAMMRLIMNSRAYQLSSVPNATNADDEQNFSHHYVRRLPRGSRCWTRSATSTGTSEAFAGRPPGTRAIELWDNRLPSYFLEIFGRPERNSPCECGRSSEPTMAQALHLMNAPEVEAKVDQPRGRVARLVGRGRPARTDRRRAVPGGDRPAAAATRSGPWPSGCSRPDRRGPRPRISCGRCSTPTNSCSFNDADCRMSAKGPDMSLAIATNRSTRRAVLRIGALAGLSLPQILRLQARTAPPRPRAVRRRTSTAFSSSSSAAWRTTTCGTRSPRHRPRFAATSRPSPPACRACWCRTSCRTWPASPTSWRSCAA